MGSERPSSASAQASKSSSSESARQAAPGTPVITFNMFMGDPAFDRLEAAIRGQNKYPAVSALYTSEDFKEGPLAFAQKRPPQWKGR